MVEVFREPQIDPRPAPVLKKEVNLEFAGKIVGKFLFYEDKSIPEEDRSFFVGDSPCRRVFLSVDDK